MFGKIKSIFFKGIFCILYVSYIAQIVYVLAFLDNPEHQMYGLALLSFEWFVLIAARYLSKKSSNTAQQFNNGFRRR